MEFLNFFKTPEQLLLKDKASIEAWLQKYKIKNFTVFGDLRVNVNGTVDLSSYNLKFIPLKFNVVEGDFYCSLNKLKNLNFAPHTVLGSFDCSHNLLKSLEGLPQTIGQSFSCNSNHLTSLRFTPSKINGSFSCVDNFLDSLEFGPRSVSQHFNCSQNFLKTLEFAPTVIKGDFNVSRNQLKNLIGSTQSGIYNYICANNDLRSLEGAPPKISGRFCCEYNVITNFNHLPEGINDILNASNNMLSLYEVLKITTKDISASLFIKNNPAAKHLSNDESQAIELYRKNQELWAIAEKEKLTETVVGPNVHAIKETTPSKKKFKL